MSSIKLPNEVWVEIMSSLSYNELKTCERVSKHFQALILNAPILAKNTFRSRHIPFEITDADDVKLHPVFAGMRNECATIPSRIYLHVRNGTDLPLLGTAAARENATEPPTKVLWLQVLYWEHIPVRAAPKGTAVTVLQATEALCRFLALKDGHGGTILGYTRGRFDIIGAAHGWTGWNVGNLLYDKRDRMVLHATGFSFK